MRSKVLNWLIKAFGGKSLLGAGYGFAAQQVDNGSIGR